MQKPCCCDRIRRLKNWVIEASVDRSEQRQGAEILWGREQQSWRVLFRQIKVLVGLIFKVTVVRNSNLTYEDLAYLAVYRNESCRRSDDRLRYGGGASGSVQADHILARRIDETWVQRREARGKWVFANQSL